MSEALYHDVVNYRKIVEELMKMGEGVVNFVRSIRNKDNLMLDMDKICGLCKEGGDQLVNTNVEQNITESLIGNKVNSGNSNSLYGILAAVGTAAVGGGLFYLFSKKDSSGNEPRENNDNEEEEGYDDEAEFIILN